MGEGRRDDSYCSSAAKLGKMIGPEMTELSVTPWVIL